LSVHCTQVGWVEKKAEKVQTAKLQRQTATDTGGHCLPTHAGY